ncbi:hypothetical protein [Geminisphaera colitermitum]|uniref:hypothetical protein n=1 Tax=Geminisphaera colitermitum TaxID=1148786 RepID=UPI000158C97F|nr:hypothetical protein [Geminisphaera colitermitum]
MGLFGSTKVESGTKAYDQSATVQDQGVGIGSGSRNTVDQSLNDNSGAITGKVGNNNTISTSIVTTSTDHGTVDAAFKFAGDSASQLGTLTESAMEGSLLTSLTALTENTKVNQSAMEATKDIANTAIGGNLATTLEAMNFGRDALSFGTDALAVGKDMFNTAIGSNMELAGTALGFQDRAMNLAVGSNMQVMDTALQGVMGAMDKMHIASLENINLARQTSNQSINAAESAITSAGTAIGAADEGNTSTQTKLIVGAVIAGLIALALLKHK